MKTQWTCLEDGIYKRSDSAKLYERPMINGVRTSRSLKTSKLSEARKILAARRSNHALSGEGLAKSPYAKEDLKTVGEVIERYRADGFLDHQRQSRPADTRKMESDNCESLLPFWGKLSIEDVTLGKCDQYCDWRRKQIVRKGSTGFRTVDLDLNTLNNAMIWAWRCEIIKFNPLSARRPKYCTDRNVKHCRDFKAKDANELHAVARWLFKKPEVATVPRKHGGHRGGMDSRTEVVGWQYLFEALTGVRTSEAIALRTDAKHGEPGFIENWKVMHVARCKSGVNPFIIITEPVEEMLRALLSWKEKRFPNSPWLFPSSTNPERPVDASTLSHNLVKASKHFGKKLTSHGARAFYVTMRRSWGISDAQIAVEIGHMSGGATLIDVYGGVPTNWLTGDAPKMSWTPTDVPKAWEIFNNETNIIKLRAA